MSEPEPREPSAQPSRNGARDPEPSRDRGRDAEPFRSAGLNPEPSENGAAHAGPSRSRRRDAAGNRARLLAVARARLTPDTVVSSRDIARAAGVSVATLYRHFPTRDALLAAARDEQAAACTASVDRAVADPDPGRALRVYLREALAAQVAAPGFRRVMAAAPDAGVRRTRFHRDMTALLARARAAGAVRPDVTVGDLLLIFAANAGVTAAGRSAARGERSRRLADLALAGLGL